MKTFFTFFGKKIVFGFTTSSVSMPLINNYISKFIITQWFLNLKKRTEGNCMEYIININIFNEHVKHTCTNSSRILNVIHAQFLYRVYVIPTNYILESFFYEKCFKHTTEKMADIVLLIILITLLINNIHIFYSCL